MSTWFRPLAELCNEDKIVNECTKRQDEEDIMRRIGNEENSPQNYIYVRSRLAISVPRFLSTKKFGTSAKRRLCAWRITAKMTG